MITIRQYLRFYSKDKDGRVILRKLFKIAKENKDITDFDYWILYFSYVECNMVENTCAKLNIQHTKYATSLNEALIRIEHTINKFDKIRML